MVILGGGVFLVSEVPLYGGEGGGSYERGTCTPVERACVQYTFECQVIATRGVHGLLVSSRGCPWLELNVPSVPGRPILL